MRISNILLSIYVTSRVSLLKSDIKTSDIRNFASLNISGNLFLVSSRLIKVSIDELYVGVAGKGFGTRLSSAQYMIVMPNK
tara:strand:+ start:2565 stop:2807 length:243 start_codon:yes stop_codon:yes gene_type:complete